MAAPASEKRCLYEVLGVSRDCTADEIRSAYRRLALQRHPDKLVRSGIPESEATASFQELVNAYEVLSDARERAWYDSHRNQILFSSSSSSSSRGSTTGFVPDLFSFFSNSVYSGYGDTGRGFYKVYGDVFEKIYANELNFARKMGVQLPREAPVMGNLGSPYAQVTAFYNYWLGFVSVLDFFWADEYDAMAGQDRRSRRMMEEENKKLRKKAKREYNETVRGLAEFVKKRDKRVIDMQVKRNKEMEKKREEEKQRKKELERQKAEKARNYEEPEWAKVEEVDDYEDDDVVEEKKNELYCVACSKKFKSDKQWRNHEQSKKHKEKVAELREAFGEEDKEFEATTAHETDGEEEKEVDVNGANSADDEVNELQEQFESTVGVEEDERDNGNTESSEENKFADVDNHSEGSGIAAELGSDDDEAIVLEAMLSGRKNRNKRGNKSKAPAEKIQVAMTSDELEFMEYNDTKGSRRSRGGRRRRAGKQEEAETQPKQAEVLDRNGEADKHERQDDDVAEPSSHTVPESETKRTAENPKQAVNKKNAKKKENAPKPVAASRGRKQKAAASGSENTCEKCGAEFESRNKLHKHLGDTGHALLKSR